MATADELARLQAAVPAAQAAQSKWRVPASVTLAQWMTESSWGTSKLALSCHNYFGIKATHLAAPDTYEEFPTFEYESGRKVLVEALFVKYPDEAASFEAHAQLLAGAARYSNAMCVCYSPKSFALALQTAGYSTSPHYAADLLVLMDEFKLCQYDMAAT